MQDHHTTGAPAPRPGRWPKRVLVWLTTSVTAMGVLVLLLTMPGGRPPGRMPVGALDPLQGDLVRSNNWAGEIDTNGTFSAVSGSWAVPSVSPSADERRSAVWVGLDGVGSPALIQVGTEQDSGPEPATYAWWEVVPAAQIKIPAPVAPGNQMEAAVTEDYPGSWTIRISDVGHWTSVLPLSYTGPAASAEWIVEAPTVDGRPATLADFGSVTFSGMSDQATGATTGARPVLLVDPNGSALAAPGLMGPLSSSVTDVYLGASGGSN